jgi:hypothetical protein
MDAPSDKASKRRSAKRKLNLPATKKAQNISRGEHKTISQKDVHLYGYDSHINLRQGCPKYKKQSHNTPMEAQEDRMYSSYSFTTSALSGQRHAPAAL